MEELVERVINKIKDITFEAKDFKEKGRISRGVKMAHEKVTEELKDLFGFDPASKRYGIDVLHRKEKTYGEIDLAIEVDTYWRPHGNWMKLSDIRAKNKLWVYITDSPDAERLLESGLKELFRHLKDRKETKESFGNFYVVMKTASGKVPVIDVFQKLFGEETKK